MRAELQDKGRAVHGSNPAELGQQYNPYLIGPYDAPEWLPLLVPHLTAKMGSVTAYPCQGGHQFASCDWHRKADRDHGLRCEGAFEDTRAQGDKCTAQCVGC